ncbi:MAG: deoxyribose-phosphate aldolase [Acidimicrobiales bacterium]
MPSTTRAELAAMIDHTLLRPEATTADVAALCVEASELAVAAVCVSPSRLPLPTGVLAGGIAVAAVCGFPSGAHPGEAKAAEARLAVEAGASEIDAVIDLGLAKEHDWAGIERQLALIRQAIGTGIVLKVIVESAILDDEELVAACRAAEAAGADFVKTSTGFHPAGGATVPAVGLMAATVGGRLGVKASGGIRTTDDALAMVEAGATRIGASRSADILAGLT